MQNLRLMVTSKAGWWLGQGQSGPKRPVWESTLSSHKLNYIIVSRFETAADIQTTYTLCASIDSFQTLPMNFTTINNT